jgi:hypothetical protein
MAQPAGNPNRSSRAAGLFLAIGLLLYTGVYAAAEHLANRNGHANPLYKIATLAPGPVDWVILGTSHAMPLDFADFNAHMQRETGARIVNLAAPGTGPLYNRFVLAQLLAAHHADNLLFVVDSFAFAARAWNEDRFADSKLLARTPLRAATIGSFAAFSLHDGVDPRAWLDYVTGFSKINNPDRFARDVWIGETQFERVYRSSASAERQRIAYLYPGGAPSAAVTARYLDTLRRIVVMARAAGVHVVAIKPPLPPRFRSLLPGEAAFDARLQELLAREGITLHDLSATLDQPNLYLDTDHLNRAGVTALFDRHLKAILGAGRVE